MKKYLVVLAAGMGSRFGGIKQIAKIGPNGETLLDYTLRDAIEAGFTDVVYVIRKEIEEDFCQIIGNTYKDVITTHYVYQEIDVSRTKPWGTAHAFLVATDIIHGPCLVVNADDYYGKQTMKQASDRLSTCKEGEFGMVGYTLKNTMSENGAVNRGICVVANSKLVSVMEHLGIQADSDGIFYDKGGFKIEADSVVSMNFWMFHPSCLDNLNEQFELWKKTAEHNQEYYIPLYCEYLLESEKASCDVLTAQDRRLGITYKEDIASVASSFYSLFDRKSEL